MALSQFAFALLFLSVYLYEVSFFIPESPPLMCVSLCAYEQNNTLRQACQVLLLLCCVEILEILSNEEPFLRGKLLFFL
jgi:hypothetical protein